MKVLIVSGIWPPDVGGPASHAPEVAAFLHERGHVVEAVVTADAPPEPLPYPVHWVSRSLPKGVVHVRSAAAIAKRALAADVVYTTGMFARTATACAVVRRPAVVKLTGDPAFERARWRGAVGGDLEAFQAGGGGATGALLRRLRTLTLRQARRIVCPSEYLRRFVVSWGMPPERVAVLPNPAPAIDGLPPRDDLRRSLGLEGVTLAYAGRFGPQKALGDAVAALERADGLSLVIAGAGEGRAELETRAAGLGERARFLGPLPRQRVLELFAAADALVLPSAWENLPHAVLEALAVGTPVIATAVGGVPELVRNDVNGLLVPPGDVAALAAAFERFAADDDLRSRLRSGAAASVERFAAERVYGELEELLETARR